MLYNEKYKEKDMEKKIVCIRLPEAIHKRLIEEVEIRYCSITAYVIRALLEQLARDEQYK
jgi:predicted HicB family RNase H-like nuclease